MDYERRQAQSGSSLELQPRLLLAPVCCDSFVDRCLMVFNAYPFFPRALQFKKGNKKTTPKSLPFFSPGRDRCFHPCACVSPTFHLNYFNLGPKEEADRGWIKKFFQNVIAGSRMGISQPPLLPRVAVSILSTVA